MFQFRGKGGKLHQTGFRDRRLARLIRTCPDLPGQRLFKYVDEDGELGEKFGRSAQAGESALVRFLESCA